MYDYKKELKELKELPKEKITQIYIIPAKEYDGFWGKNGYRSFDFIVGDDELYGWFHWEGDIIHIDKEDVADILIDSNIDNNFIRLRTWREFKITNLGLSDCTIKAVRE